MGKQIYVVLGICGIILSACHREAHQSDIVSQRYVHKYGYAVSQDEWDAHRYPGQVITTLKNGVTVTATYENGIMHGPSTHTYPHSQTIQAYYLYNQGHLVKELEYDEKGLPVKENVQLSPTRVATTLWYENGSPLSTEEYSNDELLEGQYYMTNNETEARVEKGNGLRLRRNRAGLLLAKEEFHQGLLAACETFHPTGSPDSISHYVHGILHGEKRTFSLEGEPLAIEEWHNGHLHGKSTYFHNGAKEKEISYLDGQKNGLEVHYIDGKEVLQEISWEDDKLHGSSTFYVDGVAKTQWYYSGEQVSERSFLDQSRVDQLITQISPEVQLADTR